MTCTPLARTGLALDAGGPALVAILCVIIGIALLLSMRRRRARGASAGVALVLIAGIGLAVVPSAPATAATGTCAADANSLTVTQTSSLRDLAPGVAPAAITGSIVNNGPDEAHVSAVAVQITSVSDAAGDPIDGCGASDYVLLGVVMPVERTIEPGGSATFGGGAIGFADKPINQDACMLATVHLLYTVNP